MVFYYKSIRFCDLCIICKIEGLCKRSLIGFCVQMFVLALVIATSLLNLSLHKDHREIWISLLCTCLGLLFPNPKLKAIKNTINSLAT